LLSGKYLKINDSPEEQGKRKRIRRRKSSHCGQCSEKLRDSKKKRKSPYLHKRLSFLRIAERDESFEIGKAIKYSTRRLFADDVVLTHTHIQNFSHPSRHNEHNKRGEKQTFYIIQCETPSVKSVDKAT
jgi:hypothetical protein